MAKPAWCHRTTSCRPWETRKAEALVRTDQQPSHDGVCAGTSDTRFPSWALLSSACVLLRRHGSAHRPARLNVRGNHAAHQVEPVGQGMSRQAGVS